MNRENTPRSEVHETHPPPLPGDRFKGVPLELLCDIAEVQKELNLKEEAWKRLVKAGLPVLVKVGSVSIGWTTEMVEWIKARPQLDPLPSTLRKQRQRKRRGKPK